MTDYIGQRLGNYQIMRLLGKGGFATVYLGKHIHLQTMAAIKVLDARLVDNEVETFYSEARAIARLVHPHIIRVLEFDVKDKVPFLVMDYAPHGTLRQRHHHGERVPLLVVVSYVKQIAAALQYAHDAKLVHRDVKPENILLSGKDDLLLSDFGIALLAQSSRYQSTREVAGTISYMAPEQIRGKPHPASDQYSLGIMVYEWLSGERPFQGSFTEVLAQHLSASPRPLREKIVFITPQIEQVVMTALEKEPGKRFPSVLAFAQALEQASQSNTASFTKPPDPRSWDSTLYPHSFSTYETVEPLPPTISASADQSFSTTDLLFRQSPPAQAFPSSHNQFVELEDELSSNIPLPTRKGLFYALLIGLLAGILVDGYDIATAFTHKASDFSTYATAICGAIVVYIFVFFIAGFFVGKIAILRHRGFYAGVVGGITATLLALLIASYMPNHTTINSLGSLLGLVPNLLISSSLMGLISLLGAWFATRNHPYYE